MSSSKKTRHVDGSGEVKHKSIKITGPVREHYQLATTGKIKNVKFR